MTEKISAPVGTMAGGGRSFSVAYRLEFLQAWDRCVEFGAKSRLLREHDLAYQTIKRWLEARAEGRLSEAMVAESKKSRYHMENELRAEVVRLRAENELLRTKVTNAEAAQQILGKAFGLLEEITKSPNEVQVPIPPALMTLEQYEQFLTRQNLRPEAGDEGS